MSQVELAKRYAKALLQLGHQKGKAKEYAAQIKSIATVLGAQEDVAHFFSNTTISQDLKKKSLESLFHAHSQGNSFAEDVRAFLFLLVDRNRFYALTEIAQAAEGLLDEEEGITRGKIRSSTTISEQLKSDYEKKIGAALKKKLYLEAVVDEKIMGGVRVEVGGWTFDDSLETHLNQLGDQLLKARN